jgi:hypothetical protein
MSAAHPSSFRMVARANDRRTYRQIVVDAVCDLRQCIRIARRYQDHIGPSPQLLAAGSVSDTT